MQVAHLGDYSSLIYLVHHVGIANDRFVLGKALYAPIPLRIISFALGALCKIHQGRRFHSFGRA